MPLLMIRNSLKLFVVVCFVGAYSSNVFAGDALTAAQIRKILPGSYNVSVADSVSAVAVISSGGGISVVTNKGERDTGRWTIVGNKVCVQFKHLLDHKSNCSTLMDEGWAIRGNGFTARRK